MQARTTGSGPGECAGVLAGVIGPVVVEVAAGSEGVELRDGVGAVGGGLSHLYPIMVGTLVVATGQIGKFLRSQILGDISRARQRVDRPALSGALGGSPGGAGGYG